MRKFIVLLSLNMAACGGNEAVRNDAAVDGIGDPDFGICSALDKRCSAANPCVENIADYKICAMEIATGHCGNFEVVVNHGVDTGSYSYFDLTNGKLVGLVDYTVSGSGSSVCFGVIPSACYPNPSFGRDPSCLDGGVTD